MSMKRTQQFFITLFILLLPGVGYALLRGLIYVIPLSGNNMVNVLVFAALILFFGFAIPMLIIKLGIHVASMSNPDEKEIDYKNIAKDKDQLARSQH